MRRSAAIAVAALTLALITPSAAAQAATTVHRAVLTGELGYEGGVAPGGFHPTSGSVQVAFYFLPLVLDQPVGSSGHFRITLSPGRYTVIGCGPSAWTAPHGGCSSPRNLTLRSGEVRHIRLVWAFVP
jgi:hypothetical protein